MAVAYLRLSPKDDDMRNGFAVQRAAIEAWAAAKGVAVKAWFEERGISGDHEWDKRPALHAALVAIKEHRAGVLLVAKRDRLARGIEGELINRSARRLGAVIRAADGAGDGESPADELVTGVLDVAHRYELQQIRSRTKAALQAKKARGEIVGKAPWGWQGVRNPADPTKFLPKLVPNMREREIADVARQLSMMGRSLRAIAHGLNSVGFRSRTGRLFTYKQVRVMLERAWELQRDGAAPQAPAG